MSLKIRKLMKNPKNTTNHENHIKIMKISKNIYYIEIHRISVPAPLKSIPTECGSSRRAKNLVQPSESRPDGIHAGRDFATINVLDDF